MQFIDLSATIAPSRPDALPFEQVEIHYSSHAEGASQIETMLSVSPDLLRNNEGWAVEEFTKLATHSVTHVDAPWHYNSVIRGQRAATIDELPLEWFFSDGVVLDMTRKADGEKIEVTDLETAFSEIGYNLKALDIVLIRTGRDDFYGQPDYVWRGAAVTPEATRWLYDRGVRVMGNRRLGLGRAARPAGEGCPCSAGKGSVLGCPSMRPGVFADRAPGEPRLAAALWVYGGLLPAEDSGRQRRTGPGGGDLAGNRVRGVDQWTFVTLPSAFESSKPGSGDMYSYRPRAWPWERERPGRLRRSRH